MKTIGIIGGLGPLATSDLFHKIILHTDAKRDQDHIHILVDDNPAIPDRTAAILSGGEDPTPEMVKTAKRLEAMGADFLVMPCNTAHFFYHRIISEIGIPLLHMVDETANEAVRLGFSSVGILATDGTLQTGLYDDALKKRGITPVHPSPAGQLSVMRLIYDGVKAGNNAYDISGFLDAMSEMENSGANTFILGCTELPVAFSMYGICRPALDPTDILARKAVGFAGGKIM